MSSYVKEKSTANVPLSEIPTDLFVSLAVAPVLLGVLSMHAILSWLEEVGIASEEVFRGDRLPILHFPQSESQD
jgi:hypothetical protein